MCGIAGMIRLNGENLNEDAKATVLAMTRVLAHRGPDGEGIWMQNNVCLGHRRLAIIDQKGGAQPMESWDHAFCLSYNGEIYNFKELRKLLEKKGAHFHTVSDTEVILESYRLFGEECVRYFEGMFAFALFDTKKKTLFLARDRFGKKPLFYSIQHGICFFASELSALLTVPELSFTLDPQAVVRFLAYDYVPTPDTMYKEAKSLTPSHTMLVKEHGLYEKRYWDLPSPARSQSFDQKEAANELRRLIRQAVKRRLISDVPLGVFLSGGLDSSIVTAFMAMESEKPVETFSIGFEETSYDESRYARCIAERFATHHHEEILQASVCADLLPSIVSAMDVPMADASVAPTYLLSRLTRKSVTVALGGDGSDELWAGYENYAAYRCALFYRTWPAFLRTKIIEPLCELLPGSQGYVNLHLAMQTFLAGAYAPDWLRIEQLLTSLAPDLQQKLVTQSFLAQIPNGLDPSVLFSSTRLEYNHWQPFWRARPLERAFHVYCRQFLPEDILVKVDRCSMLHSLEVRAPFLDTDLASFTAKLPLDQKCQGLKGKRLLRYAMRGILPSQILTRNKRGFQIPVAEWLRGRMRPLCEDYLSHDRLQKQGIFAPDAVRSLMDEHFAAICDRRKELWTLLVFQLWYDAHARKRVQTA
ncbi:MAG: asparagine synthase (glutamine-hydrolyzing) [Desulfovibrio sp.]|nr:asparagine synthase (glutamine-hydrolyzing) [Desulfovibrio sp.]